MLDHYLTGFFYCGMTLVAVAERCGVTPDAVEKALKRYDKEAYTVERSRRKEENGHKRRQKDRVRKHTPEAREKDRERKRRERGEANTYVQAVRNVLRDLEVVGLLRRAARELGVDDGQWACTRYIPFAAVIKHPCPGHAKEDVETITPGEAVGRAGYEFSLLRGMMAGVPGPAVLEIRPALDQGDISMAYQLAHAAVIEAGYVNPLVAPDDIMMGLARVFKPPEVDALRADLIDSARAMARLPDPPPMAELPREEKEKIVKRWLAQARAAERENVWCGTSGTGKRGKEGGIRDAGKAVMMSARTRN